MFTYSQWEEESDQVKAKLNFFRREHAEFWREYRRDRAVVEPDEKLGRITIPKKMLSSIGAQKERIFVGNDHKIEIWAKENFESGIISNEEFVSIANMLSDL